MILLKNLNVKSKILVIIALLSLCSIGSSLFLSSMMKDIDTKYSDLIAKDMRIADRSNHKKSPANVSGAFMVRMKDQSSIWASDLAKS